MTKKKRFMALPSSTCIIKPFKTVINDIQYKARVFDYYSHFYASLIELITVIKSFIIGHWSKLNRFDYFILVHNIGTTTLSITTFSIMTLSIAIFSIMARSIPTLNTECQHAECYLH